MPNGKPGATYQQTPSMPGLAGGGLRRRGSALGTACGHSNANPLAAGAVPADWHYWRLAAHARHWRSTRLMQAGLPDAAITLLHLAQANYWRSRGLAPQNAPLR